MRTLPVATLTTSAFVALALALIGTAALSQQPTLPDPKPLPAAPPVRRPDVIYVPTQPDVVRAMLTLAKVTKDDVVYDLGCGDGRIVVAAARDFGARSIGIDIDPVRVREAQANILEATVGSRARIVQDDLFVADIKDATVVTLYLLTELNMKLRPKLQHDLKPGTRIVSHAFDMGEDWPPEQTQEVGGTRIYLWTVGKPGAKPPVKH